MSPGVTTYSEVIVRTTTLKRVKDARGPFSKARERTGLDICPATLRHFRITERMANGVDPNNGSEPCRP